jgi:hypothetical protein
MLLATIAALLTLAEPVDPAPASDDPHLIVDQPATAAAPAAIPALPAPPPAPSPGTPPPSPPSAETVDESGPARPPSPPRVMGPTASFGFEIGYARGGDRFLTIPTPTGSTGKGVDAGDGVFFSLAGSWTPYWSGRGVGLGLYARLGAKFAAVEDGMTGASFLRIPFAAGPQVLLPIVGHWFALARVGVLTEVLAEIAFESDGETRTSRDFSPRLGGFIDAGMYLAPSNHASFAAIARYERLDVSYAGGVTSANNLGALGAFYYRF